MSAPAGHRSDPVRLGTIALGLLVSVSALAGCTGSSANSPTAPMSSPASTSASTSAQPTALAPAPSATSTPRVSASSTPAPSITEPTTTNTLPPPPDPTRPAASTAGSLDAAVLPVPAGWQTVIKKGDQEEGYEGNGTWVHARDPRYAATDTVTIGCAEVTRDDFTDPISALEGDYERAGQPGIGLVLQFRTSAAAARYYALYRNQVAACTDPNGPMTATILSSSLGLIDHRTYPGDDQWTEVVKLSRDRVTLIVLTDPGHAIGRSRAETILRSIHG